MTYSGVNCGLTSTTWRIQPNTCTPDREEHDIKQAMHTIRGCVYSGVYPMLYKDIPTGRVLWCHAYSVLRSGISVGLRVKTNPNCDWQFPKYCPACYIPPFLPRMENSTLTTNGEENVARDQQGLFPMEYTIQSIGAHTCQLNRRFSDTKRTDCDAGIFLKLYTGLSTTTSQTCRYASGMTLLVRSKAISHCFLA